MSEPALALRPTEIAGETRDNDFCVISEQRTVGRIREATERAGFNPGWMWSITVPLPIPAWGNGYADTFDEAKAQFKAAWVRFHASLKPHQIAHWHHHQDAAAARFSRQ